MLDRLNKIGVRLIKSIKKYKSDVLVLGVEFFRNISLKFGFN